MATLDAISPTNSLADIVPAPSAPVDAPAAPSVSSNDPIMDIRLIASIPVNLGQNMDVSA